jgi:hypothetical protein
MIDPDGITRPGFDSLYRLRVGAPAVTIFPRTAAVLLEDGHITSTTQPELTPAGVAALAEHMRARCQYTSRGLRSTDTESRSYTPPTVTATGGGRTVLTKPGTDRTTELTEPQAALLLIDLFDRLYNAADECEGHDSDGGTTTYCGGDCRSDGIADLRRRLVELTEW